MTGILLWCRSFCFFILGILFSKGVFMTELDTALIALRAQPEDRQAQSGFYDLFLNSSFFVPTILEKIKTEQGKEGEETRVPLIIDDEGIDYLVLFDRQQRLNDWAQTEAPCVQLRGFLLAEMTTEDLHWALNIGTEHGKQFVPEEIAWLKDVVKRCKAEIDPADAAEFEA
jgi:hypothetical protein